GEQVGSGEQRKAVATQIPAGDEESQQKAAEKDTACLERGKGEDFAGVGTVVIEIEYEHHELCAHQAGQSDVDAEIGDLFGIEAGSPGEPAGEPERKKKAAGHEEAVGRDEESVDVKQLGEHSESGCARSRCGGLPPAAPHFHEQKEDADR